MRTTPIDAKGKSLAELLFNKQIRGLLLTRQYASSPADQEHLIQRQERMMPNAPKLESKQLIEGQFVFVQKHDAGPWTHGTILENLGPDHAYRSYCVQLSMSGRKITCNIKHLKPTAITPGDYQSSNQPTQMSDEQMMELIQAKVHGAKLAKKALIQMIDPPSPPKPMSPAVPKKVTWSPTKTVDKPVPPKPVEVTPVKPKLCLKQQTSVKASTKTTKIEPAKTVMTRSGCAVKAPAWKKDFVVK